MYSQITSNKRKTAVLIAIFMAFIVMLGYIIGQYTGYGYNGLILAAGISIAMTLVSYFSGDKIALLSAGAKLLAKNDNPYLWRLVENLSITAGVPMPKLYIMEEAAINAFATGRNPAKASIAVTRGALEKLENEELEGVLAHELSHIKNYDIRVMMIVGILLGTVVLLGDWLWRVHLFGRRRDENRNTHPALMIIGVALLILSPLIGQLIQLAVSRKREFLADASGSLLTRFPEGLARALEKIGQENNVLKHANHATAHLFISNPFGKTKNVLGKLFMTHPPLEERIAILRKIDI